MKIVESFGTRLKKAIDNKGISQLQLAEKSNISKSAINDYIKDKYEPSRKRISIFANILNVSEVWLIGYDVPYMDQKINPEDGCKKLEVEHIVVPLFGRASAGRGYLNLSEEINTFNLPAHLYQVGVFTVLVEGDSMTRFDGQKFIADNSIVVVTPAISNIEDIKEKVCIFTYNDETFIKQLIIDNDGTIRLRSFNPNYKDIIVDKPNLLKCEGKVISSFLINDWN